MKSGNYLGGDRIVSGYPYIEGRSSEWGIHQRLLVLVTSDRESKPSVSAPTQYDAFFVLNKTGYNVRTGREENIPLLHGVSGGGIWICIKPAHQDIWKPLASLKVIASQVSMAEDQTWFRGSYWDAVADIFCSNQVGLTNPSAAFGPEFSEQLSEDHQKLDAGGLSIPPEKAD